MKSLIPEPLQKRVLSFKKQHKDILIEWQSIKKKADKELFNKYCKKDYYKECDPLYCTFYNTNECKYPSAITELDSLIEL